MRITAIILNYRTSDLAVDCLASLQGQSAPGGFRAVVLDNASGDGSADRIQVQIDRRGWGRWARLVRSPVNGGFAAGNNAGIRAARQGPENPEAFLLLNSDTIVRPGAVAGLARELERHPEVGLVGPRLEWPDGRPQISAFRFPTPVTELLRAAGTGALDRVFSRHVVAIPPDGGPGDAGAEPGWVSFAAVLIRREAFERTGPMDEGYFMYHDDVDYCRRARAAGWRVRYCPSARVVHLRGQSGPVKANAAARKRLPPYWYHSRSRYYAKFYGRGGLWLANALWTAGYGIHLARRALDRRPSHIPQRQWRDIWANWRDPLRAEPPRAQAAGEHERPGGDGPGPAAAGPDARARIVAPSAATVEAQVGAGRA